MTRRTSLSLGCLATSLAMVLAACNTSATDTTEIAAPATTTSTTTTTTSATTTTTTPATTTMPAVETYHPPGMGWELVWSDEFDGTKLDEDKWGFEENCWGGGNEEQQCYTDRLDNTILSDGLLHIRAIEEQYTGLDGSQDWDNADELSATTLPYTSARVRTKGKGDWRYGRFEIRAQLPFGQGVWPAIWMLPTDYAYGSGASSGEIDITEAVNLKTVWAPDTNAVHGTLHYGAESPSNASSGTFLRFFGDDHPADTFHVYAIEWEEGEIRWYVDDIHYATQIADGWYSQVAAPDGTAAIADGTAPFDQPFHLILNVAVGGTWPGPTDNTTVFPQEMLVDYVRVYECSNSPEDGTGCGTSNAAPNLVAGPQPPELAKSIFTGPFAGEFDSATLGDVMTVFEDDQVFPWKLGSYIDSGSLDFDLVETGDEDHGTAIETTFNTNEAIVYFQAATPYNLSDWSDGAVEFDMRVVTLGSSTARFMMKVDCQHPCSSGDFPLEDPVAGAWTHYAVPISELLTISGSSLDLERVNAPLVIFPAWGSQDGVVMQIDNVAWTR